MNKILSLASLLLILAATSALACTNLIVGKKASTTGAVMCTYSADSYGHFAQLHFIPAAKHAPGDMYEIYDYDSNEHRGSIPEVAETYNVVGHINEHKVSIMETTFGGREGLENKDGIMDYGSLIYITLQRARTAREAIRTIDELMQTYGYPTSGESFSIADKDECWIMEIIGKEESVKRIKIGIDLLSK